MHRSLTWFSISTFLWNLYLLTSDDVCTRKGSDRSFFGWADFGLPLVLVICFRSLWFSRSMASTFALLNDIFLRSRGGGRRDSFRCTALLGLDLEAVDIEERLEAVSSKSFSFSTTSQSFFEAVVLTPSSIFSACLSFNFSLISRTAWRSRFKSIWSEFGCKKCSLFSRSSVLSRHGLPVEFLRSVFAAAMFLLEPFSFGNSTSRYHSNSLTSNIQQMFPVPDFSHKECFEHAVIHFLFSGLSSESLRVEEFRRGMEAKLKENGWWVLFWKCELFYFLHFVFIPFKA